jgi:hypothetical protein
MKPFKEFIAERNYTFSDKTKEWEFTSNGDIPLQAAVLQDLERDIKAYHVTSLKGLVKLKKLQGKRKDISTFTQGSTQISQDGIATTGGILTKLEGKTSVRFAKDAFTRLDRNGNRWIYRDNQEDYDDNILKRLNLLFANEMLSTIKKEYKSELEQTGKDNPDTKELVDLGGWDYWSLVREMVKSMNGASKGKFVGFYMRMAKKILDVHTVNSIVSTLKFVDGYDEKDRYDEILMHQFKIIEVHHYQTERGPTLEEVQAAAKSIGFRGKVVSRSSEYIRKINPMISRFGDSHRK